MVLQSCRYDGGVGEGGDLAGADICKLWREATLIQILDVSAQVSCVSPVKLPTRNASRCAYENRKSHVYDTLAKSFN